MTFAIGLASVFVFNGSLKFSDEISVDLPKVQFESSLIVFSLPKKEANSSIMLSVEQREDERQFGGGASGGTTCDEARARAKNKKLKIPNCD